MGVEWRDVDGSKLSVVDAESAGMVCASEIAGFKVRFEVTESDLN